METFGLEDISSVALRLLELRKGYDLILFHGDMGAGKTTLIRALCKGLGVEETVSSPTFSLVNEYRDRNDYPIYHFDFYRIEDEQEALDIGLYDYFDSGDLCLVEWPSCIESLIPEKHLSIQLTAINSSKRQLELSYHGKGNL